MLAHMAKDPDKNVRRAAAANPTCPPHLLEKLGADPETSPSVARNRAASPDLPARLAGQDTGLYAPLSANPSTPPDAMARLS